MSNLETALLNENIRNPGMYIKYDGNIHLFDCGRHNFSMKFVNKLKNIYVSHRHMDHFSDFDGIVRLMLHSNRRSLNVFGPEGMFESVRAKIKSYTWNLTMENPLCINTFDICKNEIAQRGISLPSLKVFYCEKTPIKNNVIFDDDDYFVKYIEVPHGTQCLGYSFNEKNKFKIDKNKLKDLNIIPNEWVNDLKNLAEEGNTDSIIIVEGESIPYSELSGILVPVRGEKIVYITDFALLNGTLDKLKDFAKDANLIYCESNYADRDKDLAVQNFHLTAKEAGVIAKEANAEKLVLFHFSPRYKKEELIEEATKYFKNVR
jgi:ribonuclease Z